MERKETARRASGETKEDGNGLTQFLLRSVTDRTRSHGCLKELPVTLGSLSRSRAEPDMELGPHLTHLLSILSSKEAL